MTDQYEVRVNFVKKVSKNSLPSAMKQATELKAPGFVVDSIGSSKVYQPESFPEKVVRRGGRKSKAKRRK